MKNEAGFTLIEIIVSLILVGIMASVAGMGIVTGVKGYLFAKDNAAVSGKAQLAMSRLSRTFMEVLDITTASPTQVTYKRLSGGVSTTETLYLHTDNTIKIAGGGSASGGDTLVDHVSSLALTYQKGVATWAPGTDDFSLLSTVGVTLVLTRPDGGSNVTFSTVITPRNNANTGGSSTTVHSAGAGAGAGGGGCFVATAAFGQPDHPLALLLREFRDRYLLTWAGGRMMVKIYYAGGPYLADLIRDRGWACTLTQWILLPFAGMAFLMLYAPQAVPFIFLLSWVAVSIFFKFIRRGQKMAASVTVNQRGTILLGLIGTMVIFSVLGAAMLSFTNSSTFNQVTSTGSARAYYLAEGGMRYAGGQFKNAGDENAKDNMLESLNGHDFSMGSDGAFHLDIYPYYLKTTAIPSGATLSAKFPGSVPTGMSIPTTGYLKIGNSDTTPRPYTSYTQSGSNINFTMSPALTGFTAAVNNVLPVGQASSTTLSRGGTLTLSSGAGSFPLINGTFTIGTAASTIGANPAVFVYKTRSGNDLQEVKLSQTLTEAFSVSVPAGAYITLMKFVNLSSRGTYTPLQASRTISYSIPIGLVSGDKAKLTDTFTFEDLSHWNTEGELGTHKIKSNEATDNSNALHVETTDQYTLGSGLRADRALLTLNWGSTDVDLNQFWNLAGNFLSYDAQVKIKVADQPDKYYMAGIIFRVDTSGQMYGVSYLRPNRGESESIDNDGIPEELCPPAPTNKKPLIVLWQQTSGNNVKWLAYKELASADGVVDDSDNLAPWSTILVRVVEAASVKLTASSAPLINLGDTITGAGSPAGTAKVIRKINDSDGKVVLLLNNIEGTFTRPGKVGDYYTDSTWGYRARDNYIRAYYGNTSNLGTANADPLDNNRLGNARLTTGGEVTWPVDDVADWAAANDAFTLVQWNNNMDASVARLGTGSEANAIIRTNALTTPSSGTFTQPELGLDTWGTHSTSVYFDDFGLQTSAPGQTQGFLAAIQQ